MTVLAASGDFLKVNDPYFYNRFLSVEAGAVVALSAAPVDAVAATATLTSDNTNVADGATVTIGNKTYTFKTALTPTEGEVLIGANADASLLNLIRAINHTGTPDTDYSCAAAHTQVSAASSVTSHAFAVTALTAGAAANAYATTETSSHLSFGSATMSGGVDGTAGTPMLGYYDGNLYVCLSTATTATAGAWKKITLGSL